MGRLLILDDEPAIGHMIMQAAQRAGVEARYCRTAGEFFPELERWAPSHLLIDLVMPQFDGVEVLSRLAQTRTSAGVIITSGLGGRVLQTAERAATARGLCVLGVLAKPFSMRALRELLSATVEEKAGAEPGAPAAAVVVDELDRALANAEFFAVYQPKWLVAERRALGLEVLVRWAHPSRGVIGPDDFVAYLEDTGRIGAMTDQVLRDSLDWFGAIGACQHLLLEVNLSALAVGTDLPERLSRYCAAAGVAPERVVLELTETSRVCDSVGAAEVLNRLRIRGFGLAIDDFGIGYSSMSQLAMFPFTELKIDRSFVASIGDSDEMRSIVHSSISLGKRMGMTTVAEGVEDRRTLDLLAGMGCDAVQGYAISQPLCAAEAADWVREHGR